jgi:hypothetical protein
VHTTSPQGHATDEADPNTARAVTVRIVPGTVATCSAEKGATLFISLFQGADAATAADNLDRGKKRPLLKVALQRRDGLACGTHVWSTLGTSARKRLYCHTLHLGADQSTVELRAEQLQGGASGKPPLPLWLSLSSYGWCTVVAPPVG